MMISQNDLLFALNIQLFQECFISREKGNVFLENIINVVKDTSAPNINKSKLIIFVIDMCNNYRRNEKKQNDGDRASYKTRQVYNLLKTCGTRSGIFKDVLNTQ